MALYTATEVVLYMDNEFESINLHIGYADFWFNEGLTISLR